MPSIASSCGRAGEPEARPGHLRAVTLERELLELDRGFWIGGEDYFLAHVDARCMLLFAEMQGVHTREEVAATARGGARWRDVRPSKVLVHQPAPDFALIGYEAKATRADGTPYHALIGSAYVRRGGAWKLSFHQHSKLG